MASVCSPAPGGPDRTEDTIHCRPDLTGSGATESDCIADAALVALLHHEVERHLRHVSLIHWIHTSDYSA